MDTGIFVKGYLEKRRTYQKDANAPVYYNLDFSAGRSGLLSVGCTQQDFVSLAAHEKSDSEIVFRIRATRQGGFEYAGLVTGKAA